MMGLYKTRKLLKPMQRLGKMMVQTSKNLVMLFITYMKRSFPSRFYLSQEARVEILKVKRGTKKNWPQNIHC